MALARAAGSMPATAWPSTPGMWPAGEGPAVLVDNAHWNSATTSRGLAVSPSCSGADGYRVLPDGNSTRAEMLADADIGVVANPLGSAA